MLVGVSGMPPNISGDSAARLTLGLQCGDRTKGISGSASGRVENLVGPQSACWLRYLDLPGHFAGGLFEDVSQRSQPTVDQLAVGDTGFR